MEGSAWAHRLLRVSVWPQGPDGCLTGLGGLGGGCLLRAPK